MIIFDSRDRVNFALSFSAEIRRTQSSVGSSSSTGNCPVFKVLKSYFTLHRNFLTCSQNITLQGDRICRFCTNWATFKFPLVLKILAHKLLHFGLLFG